jgi:hypothetical protein
MEMTRFLTAVDINVFVKTVSVCKIESKCDKGG